MSIPLPKVQFLSYDDTKPYAEDFLNKYHHGRDIPVPIEKIVDNLLRINIIPVPGLINDLNKLGSNMIGLLSSDLQNLYVDKYISENYPNMFRFTLAHEMGHVFLHKNVYEKRPFDSVEECVNFVLGFQDGSFKDFRRYEMQAHNFAGLILMPSGKFEDAVGRCVEKFREVISDYKESFRDEELAWEQIFELIAREFQVSPEAVRARIDCEKMRGKYELF